MMYSIDLKTTPIDDPDFVRLVSSFVNHYANLYRSDTVSVIHVDNWFGDRWLGFAGKFIGAAGVRSRKLNDTTLPSPPFRPSRIEFALTFDFSDNTGYSIVSESLAGLHAEKNGGQMWDLRRPGIYCWYSGKTSSNTTGALMMYDVTRDGSSGWYVGFERSPTWRVTRSINIAFEECKRIANRNLNAEVTEQHERRGQAD
jgi:hypothetical protein